MGKSTRKRKSVKSNPEASQDGDEMSGVKQSVEEQICNLQSEQHTLAIAE